MPNTPAQNMKTAIITDLQSLVTSGVLFGVMAVDFTKSSVWDYVWSGYPSALVTPPTVTTSEYEDVGDNLREYTWNILIVTTPENLPASNPSYLESLIDQTLQAFDNDCTLQGSAVGGVQPAVLDPPGPVSNGTVTYVTFYITLKAKALVPGAVQIN
jgi:hypothetical protein